MDTEETTASITYDLHVFHYPTHSAVVGVEIVQVPYTDSTQPERTRTGQTLLRTTRLFASAEDAGHFLNREQDRAGWWRDLRDINIITHETAPLGRPYAARITADNDESGNPRRGWQIYSATGQYLGFVDEGYDGHQALKRVGDVIELGSTPVDPQHYAECLDQVYPLGH